MIGDVFKESIMNTHFDGYDPVIEIIVHLYSYTRYTGRSLASRRNDSPEIRVVPTTANFKAKQALLLFVDSIRSLWQCSSNRKSSF